MGNKYLVPISEAAKIFGLGRDRLYAMVKCEPDLPILKIGKIIKINVPLMEEWINRATKEGRKL